MPGRARSAGRADAPGLLRSGSTRAPPGSGTLGFRSRSRRAIATAGFRVARRSRRLGRPAAPGYPSRTTDGAAQLARLIRENQPCVALTGAGASTESGIPDFRSPTGIWAQFDPREYGSLGAFRRDPTKVWRFYAPRFSMLTDAEPNRAHYALAELERLGLLEAVVTQNIDLLHERAGSENVVEVHGSIRTSSCPSCAAHYALAEVLRLVEAGDGAPRCTRCEAILKP